MEAPISAAQRRLLVDLAAQVPQGNPPDCVRVAVDGVDGAGKTTFADQLAAQLRDGGRDVVRISIDDFHQPRTVRYRRGRTSPEGFWLDSYDLRALHRWVLQPLGPGGDRRYRSAAHDLATDRPVEPPEQTVPAGGVLVLDGLFLHRDDLLGTWDLSIFLQAPFSVTVPRMATRDGSSADPGHPSPTRYVQGQGLYFAACSPWTRADVVVNNTNVDTPAVVA